MPARPRPSSARSARRRIGGRFWFRLLASICLAAALSATAAIGADDLVPLRAVPAGAHAQLLETSPVNDTDVESLPTEVSLRFDESMEITGDAVRVLGPDGGRVDSSRTRLSDDDHRLTVAFDDAGRGTYTVGWRATSADGHTLTGSFVFHFQERTGAQTIDDSRPLAVSVGGGLARWLGFVGIITALGAVGLAIGASDGTIGRLRRVAVGGSIVGAVGAAVLLVTETATTSGRGVVSALSLVPEVGLGSKTGQMIAGRAALLVVAALVASRPKFGGHRSWVPLVPLGLAAMASAASGHPWSASSRPVAVLSDTAHLVAAGVWIGGAIALLAVFDTAEDRNELVRRFSRRALFLVVVVATTGVVSALFQVSDIEALTSTPYGLLLLGKVALFGVLVVIGWVNRTRIVPAVETMVSALARNLTVEVAVAAMLLGLTAGLVEQPPARVAVNRPFDSVITVDGASLQVTVEPARVGENTVHLYFFDEAGMTPLPVDAVELTAAIGEVPSRRLDILPESPNHVSAYGASLGAPGTWTLEVTAVSSGAVFDFTVEVPVR